MDDETELSTFHVDRSVVALEEPAFSPKHIRLLRSTYRVMAKRGVRRISLQDAARAAGVSKGILLYYFGSKENLVLSTMRWVLGRVARRIQAAVFQAPSAEEKVAAMIDAIFFDARANRDFYLVFIDLMTYAARSDRFDKLTATFRSIVNAFYEHVIAEGNQEGVFHVSNAAEAAAVVRALVDGLSLQWLGEPQWEALHPQLRTLCKRAVLGYLQSGADHGLWLRPAPNPAKRASAPG